MGGGWALEIEIEAFLGPVKCHRALLKENFFTCLQKWEGLKIMLLRETADDRTT